ncbi:MAG: hypothetical protein OEL20_19155 [Sulfuritalea sp.]|nr:hypothetical protein [Sulfuritalea sp.]
MTCIVAVAAPIGGGKTSLVQGLAQALDGASTVHFDHYELATQKSPAELARWIADGADFNEIQAPGLLTALEALKRGEAATDPVTGARIVPGDHVVLEMPLGREYAATAHLIDIVIWVEIPLDVALARNIKSLAADALADPRGDARDFLRWLEGYLGHYTGQVRTILEVQKLRVSAGADVVVDGLQAPEALVAAASAAVGKFKTCG